MEQDNRKRMPRRDVLKNIAFGAAILTPIALVEYNEYKTDHPKTDFDDTGLFLPIETNPATGIDLRDIYRFSIAGSDPTGSLVYPRSGRTQLTEKVDVVNLTNTTFGFSTQTLNDLFENTPLKDDPRKTVLYYLPRKIPKDTHQDKDGDFNATHTHDNKEIVIINNSTKIPDDNFYDPDSAEFDFIEQLNSSITLSINVIESLVVANELLSKRKLSYEENEAMINMYYEQFADMKMWPLAFGIKEKGTSI